MAEGALKNSRAQVSLAITGIAWQGGGTTEKPVGLVCFAWAGLDRDTVSSQLQFSGNRESVRRQAVETALTGLLDFIAD